MIALILSLVVAALHTGFMVLETFLWTTPGVRKRFGQTVEQAAATRVFAANQGVYNGALAASLAWATLSGDTGAQVVLLLFVVFVGLYGAWSVKPTIFFIQALPALLALAASFAGI